MATTVITDALVRVQLAIAETERMFPPMWPLLRTAQNAETVAEINPLFDQIKRVESAVNVLMEAVRAARREAVVHERDQKV